MNLRFLVLSGVAVGCLALAAPAQAKTCPSGQILRVSKNTCMDKGEAVKLGILRGGAGKATSAAKTQKAAIAKVETDEDDAPKTKAKPKSGPRPDKTARAAPEKPVDEARPARAVAAPKDEGQNRLPMPTLNSTGSTLKVPTFVPNDDTSVSICTFLTSRFSSQPLPVGMSTEARDSVTPAFWPRDRRLCQFTP